VDSTEPEESALRFVVPLDLAPGEREFALRAAMGSVVTGPKARPGKQLLVWRGEAGVVAVAGLAPEGALRPFPAGAVGLVPLGATVLGVPADSAEVDRVHVAPGV
ncbi:MAG: hypothetical protein AAFP22_13630, partial [Planctomycetota bacterium]